MNHTIKENIQAHNELKRKIQLEKNRARKERTHRLIQKGALVEKYFDLQETSPEETEIFLKKIKKRMSDLN